MPVVIIELASRFWTRRQRRFAADFTRGTRMSNLERNKQIVMRQLRPSHDVHRVLAQGDLVVTHATVRDGGAPGAVAVQDEATAAESKSGLPMIGGPTDARARRP